MPEPKSGRDGLTIPEKFDPFRHCGAKLRIKNTVCMKTAGERTPHPNEGRCYLHGGISGTLKHGYKSKIYGKERPGIMRQRLLDRIDELKSSPELLTLDTQIATLRAYIERQHEALGIRMDRYDDFMEIVAAQDDGELPNVPPELFPLLETGHIETLAKLVKTEYEMKFARRFSVPIEEVGAIVMQIVAKFNKLADEYSLPPAARQRFAVMMSEIRTSRPMEDVALMRAGQGAENSWPRIVEGPIEDVG